MTKKYLWALIAAVVALPALAFAQTDIAVENTGIVERPMVEGQPLPETHYVHTILWTDSDAASYNVYVSDAPISDIDAANVFQIGTDIPVGQQAYEYPLQTPHTPGDVNNYYAVTASGSSEVTAGVNATTEATPGTQDWAQPMYWFTEEPFIDGDFSEWTFPTVDVSPDNPDNFWSGELDGADDFSYSAATGIDADNIYFRVEAVDDLFVNVNEDGAASIWQGDSMEWYHGMYDLRPSKPRHPTFMYGNESDPSKAEPDVQYVIAGNAFDNPQRSHVYLDRENAGELQTSMGNMGLEVQSLETDNGWLIEARLPLEGLVLDPAVIAKFEAKLGKIIPTIYAGNDGDDPAGGRQVWLASAKDEAAINSWNTPSAYQQEQVIYDPRVFGLGEPSEPSTAVEEQSWGQIKSGFSQ